MVPDDKANAWFYPLKAGDTLSNHDWFELHFHRLLGSRLVAHAIAEGRREDIATALLLWAESIRQDPAGTLPSDDVELAALAKFGTDVERWRQARRWALHGWRPVIVEDRDGEVITEARLGHPVIAPVVERMYARFAARAQGRVSARMRLAKTRIRQKLAGLGRKRIAGNGVVVDALAEYLDRHGLFITDDNVIAALDLIGVPKVVARIGPDGGETEV